LPPPRAPLRPSSRAALLAPLLLTLAACLAACQGAPAPAPAPAPPRTPRPRPPYKNDPWLDRATVDAGGEVGVGLYAQLATAPSGRVGVAYWDTDGREGDPCDGIEVDDPPAEVRWGLSFAEWREGEGWTSEKVGDPLLLGPPPGLHLSYTPNNTPQVLALSGDPVPEIRYCGGSDLGLFTPSGGVGEPWEAEWVVTDSDQASSGEAASDYGYVVGYWPSHARRPDGAELVVYQDVHGGSLQRDDLARADLEVALRDTPTGAWRYEPVDVGEGAGTHTQALFGPQGEPMALYYIPIEASQEERVRQGVWLARQINGEWRTHLVAAGPVEGGAQAVVIGEGLAVLYFDPQARQPVLATLSDLKTLDAPPDPTAPTPDPWRRARLGDPRYHEGRTPRLARAPDGRLAALWYRCAPAELAACRPADDGVIFALSPSPAEGASPNDPAAYLGEWTREIVESGEEGVCGIDPTLTFDTQGRAWAAWRCSRRGEGGAFQYRLEAARREE
jgi:hypothetical protein